MTSRTRRPITRAANTSTADSTIDWRMDAACASVDPELFFPVGTTHGPADDQVKAAKEVCTRCPVMDQCLNWALDTRQKSGIWGGLDEDERRLMLRRQAARAARAVAA